MESPSTIVILLNQFSKLVFTIADKGLHLEDDDIYRDVHAGTRQMVSEMMTTRKEVATAVEAMFDHMLEDGKVYLDKIAGFFNFLTRSGYPITDQ